MKKKLVIFGIGKIAEVVYYYASEECGFEVAAFCVDSKYITADTFLGKSVVAFEDIAQQYGPTEFDMFVAIGYHDLNELRKTKCQEAMSKGYELVSVVSSNAKLPSNVTIGKNCFIMPPCVIHPCVAIGDNVFVWSGAMVGHHSIINSHCWLTSSCNIGGNVVMGEQTFIAMGATVSQSVEIGSACFLGANVLVTKKMEDGQVVIAEAAKPIRLNSHQFLRMSQFSSL